MRDLDEHQQAAFDLLTGPQAPRGVRHLRRDARRSRDRYGRHTFGQSALLARRLVEHGVTFVTVNCVPWDHHGSPGQYKISERPGAAPISGSRSVTPPGRRGSAPLAMQRSSTSSAMAR